MKKRRILCLILIVAMIFTISFLRSELDVVYAKNNVWELKLGVKMAENHLESQGTKKFIELSEEKSKGKLKIVAYWGGSLGNAKVQLENVMDGIQDMYIESYTAFFNYVPDFSVHSIPYLFKTDKEYQRFLLSPIEKEMEEKLLQKTGIRLINENKNWIKTYRAIASKKPLLTLKDIKGIKIRQCPSCQMTIKFWSSVGADVVIIPWSETYLALQQGMANAVTCGVTSLHSDKFAEQVKNVAESHEYYQQLIIAMNDKKYQSLPEELKIALNEASNEAGDFFSQLMREENSRIQEKLEKDYNVKYYEFPYEEIARNREVFFQELEQEDLIPAGLIDRILSYLK